MKKRYALLLLLVFFIIGAISIAYIIGYLVLQPSPFPIGGNADSWIQYWGSFLGALIGVLGAYLTMYIQINYDKSIRMRNGIMDELENTLSLKRKMDITCFRLEFEVDIAEEKFLRETDKEDVKIIFSDSISMIYDLLYMSVEFASACSKYELNTERLYEVINNLNEYGVMLTNYPGKVLHGVQGNLTIKQITRQLIEATNRHQEEIKKLISVYD